MSCILTKEEKARSIGLGSQGGTEEDFHRKNDKLNRIQRYIRGKHYACGDCVYVCFVPTHIPTEEQLKAAGIYTD